MVIAFNGSPHRQGNTAAVMEQILKGAASLGQETKYVDLNQLSMKGCQGCFGCQRPESTGACVMNDDMKPLFDEIYKADAIVLGSSVYMGQMTGQTKQFFDRFFAFIRPDFSSRVHNKKTALVMVHGQSDPKLYKPYADMTAGALTSMGFPVVDTLIGAGLYAPGMATKDDALMAKAYELGRKLGQEA